MKIGYPTRKIKNNIADEVLHNYSQSYWESELSERKATAKRYIKVKTVIPLFPVGYTRAPLSLIPELREQLSRPIIELRLEDNRTLRLMGIPVEVAMEIWFITNNKQQKPTKDFRLSVTDLICELVKVKRVIISDIIPELGVYVADVELEESPSSNNEKKVFRMIPSHAILVALKCGAEIYVSEKLLKLEREEEEEKEGLEEDITYW